MNTPARNLVLHADDLGLNRAVTDGILRGFREGLLTSTSLLANAPDAVRALRQWKALAADQRAKTLPSASARNRLGEANQPFDLGVHLNLTQGRPLSAHRYPRELLDAEGRFPGVFSLFHRLICHGRRFRAAIREELQQQVGVVGDHGLQPTHLNGHQYVEMLPALAEIVSELLDRFGIQSVRVAKEPALLRSTVLHGQFWKWPLARVKRSHAERFGVRMDARDASHADIFFGTAHAGRIDLGLLRLFLAHAAGGGLVEVGLHPGESAAESPEDRADGWHDPLADARVGELQMLLADALPEMLASSGWRLGRLIFGGRSREPR
jgi:predicted glycoside hydrolase/deacetylase ChbG (UPF0249 family)